MPKSILTMLKYAGEMAALFLFAAAAQAQSLPSPGDVPPQVDSFVNPGAPMPDGAAMPSPRPAAAQQLSDLTLGNFFSEGWNDDFAQRKRATGTPDVALLRVQTVELFRLWRQNFYEQSDVNSPTRKNVLDYDAFVDWAFNRRVMIEMGGAYQWSDARTGPDTSGGFPFLLTRVKLVDTDASAYTFNFKVAAPDPSVGVFDSTFTYGITSFQDLGYWFNWDRVGLYYCLTFDTLAGPAAAGAKRNDVQYDVSIAKTVTGPDAPIFRTLTFFEENFAQTDLDGPTDGRTYVTASLGFRFNFANLTSAKMGSSNVLMCCVDIPVSTYQPWTDIWRLTYIRMF